MNKRLILEIAILAMVALTSLYLVIRSESAKITTFEECEKAGWLVDRIANYDGYDAKCVLWNDKVFVKQRGEPPFIPLITTEPESLPLTTKEYVYDDKLGYSFEYPDGWEFFINIDKDVEQCDPSLNYEAYTCVDFPDKNIKKVISFTKKLSALSSLPPPQIDFTVKTAADLQEATNKFKKEVEASNIPILNEAVISVNNISGYDILSGTPDWKLRQVVFFANEMAYIFKYSSQEEFYRMYEETYNNIVNSFNIK